MKKVLTSLIVLAMFVGTGAAFADDTTALTTKNYVDSGLKAVYQEATAASTAATNAATAAAAAQSDVNSLSSDVTALTGTVTTINTTVGTHTSDITELKSQVSTLQANSSDTTYAAGTGITIDASNNNAVSVTGLATTTQEGNTAKRYIYQNGVLTELEVANTWNPSVLN